MWFWHVRYLQLCVSIWLSSPSQNRKYCPRQHAASFGVASNYFARRCDLCRSSLAFAKGFTCLECDFDVCRDCAKWCAYLCLLIYKLKLNISVDADLCFWVRLKLDFLRAAGETLFGFLNWGTSHVVMVLQECWCYFALYNWFDLLLLFQGFHLFFCTSGDLHEKSEVALLLGSF